MQPPRPDWQIAHGLLLLVFIAAAAFLPALRGWPLLWLAPLAAYGVTVIALPPLRTSFRPWKVGRITTGTVLAAAFIACGSCVTLAIFHRAALPDTHAFADYLPVSSLGGLVAAGILFSIFNALFEELIFRGILFDSLESQWGPWGAALGTSLLFGYGHMHGYPPGVTGALLAGIYGLCLAWLRVRTGGLALGFLAHIAADATIFTLVARGGF